MMTWRLGVLTVLLLGALTSARIVDTEFGPVQGQDIPIHTGQVIESYLGINFAKPPLGSLRFQPPQNPDPWTEVFDAYNLRSACPQGGGLFVLTHPFWNDTNEDCLHLNVFAPQDMSGAPYAVMVWFHGGGYTGSANIQYPGHFLASKGVVMVVPNYRLGHLGFLTTGDSVAWGNYGMLDQVKALQWIQNNIGAFGGDPGRVTLFGQSAGASSSSLHMFSPLSRGLFHQVIAESGSDLALWAVNWPNQNPENYTRQVAEKLSCPTNDNQAMVDCLRTIDAQELYKVPFDCKPGHFCQGMAPVVDFPAGFLPRTPHEYRLDGDFQKVNMISGVCAEDGSWYTTAFVPEAFEGGFNRTEFLYYLRERLVSIFAPRLPGQLEEDVFEAMNFIYTDWPDIEDREKNRQAINMVLTDAAFGVTMDAHLKSQKEYNPNVYQYIMGYRSSNASEFVPEWMGVPHNGELPYVVGYPFLTLNEAVRDNMQIYFDIVEWHDEDIAYAEYINTLWTNFAKFGNPTPSPVQKPLTPGTISWPTVGDELNYLHLDRDVTTEIEYRQKSLAFWTEYFPYVAKFNLIPTSDSATDSARDSAGESDEVSGMRMRSDDIETAITDNYQRLLREKLDLLAKK